MVSVDFKVPGPAERLDAVGETSDLPPPLRRAFDPGEDFAPVPEPGPSDWLAVHKEEGQTFADFEKAKKNVPDKERKRIYFLPLGDFKAEGNPSLDSLKEFAAAFFGMEVAILPSHAIGKGDFTPRVNSFNGKRQLLTSDILGFLRKKLPGDAFCLLAITMEDLYPEPSWNFVFGQASLRGRTGVYSFARYDPAFYGERRGKDAEKLILRRSAKVLAHETAHMFGLLHCTFYSCLMNGSNHLDEADSRPLHLCPVCLRKLQSSVKFDVADRYRKLEAFYKKVKVDDEAAWLEGRLRWLEPKKDEASRRTRS